MDWRDRGIVLSARPHGENAVVATLLTENHGRHAGLVRGGLSSKSRGIYEPGNLVTAEWRARLSEHLGSFKCELISSYASSVLDSPLRLAGLSAMCALAEKVLPEREPHLAAFDSAITLLEAIDLEAWPSLYVRWEAGLLGELGFGLDLTECAATGLAEELIFVSPKSGRAVSRDAGAPYRDKLLTLPAFLKSGEPTEDVDAVLAGLKLTGYFVERHVLEPHNMKLPAARTRFIDRLEKLATISGGLPRDIGE
jgi:DNA repair protein RecO (recombination protein O)